MPLRVKLSAELQESDAGRVRLLAPRSGWAPPSYITATRLDRSQGDTPRRLATLRRPAWPQTRRYATTREQAAKVVARYPPAASGADLAGKEPSDRIGSRSIGLLRGARHQRRRMAKFGGAFVVKLLAALGEIEKTLAPALRRPAFAPNGQFQDCVGQAG